MGKALGLIPLVLKSDSEVNAIEVERDYEASWGDAHALRFEDRRDQAVGGRGQAVGGRGQLYSLSHGTPSHPKALSRTEGMVPPYKKLLFFILVRARAPPRPK